MEKAFVKKSKYDKLIEQFAGRKEKTPWYTLREFAREKGVNYDSFRRATQRKGVKIKTGIKNPNPIRNPEASGYTILQFGVGKTLFNQIKAKAEIEKISIPELIRKELEESLK